MLSHLLPDTKTDWGPIRNLVKFAKGGANPSIVFLELGGAAPVKPEVFNFRIPCNARYHIGKL